MVLGTCQPNLLSREQRRALAGKVWWEGMYSDTADYDIELELVTGLERSEREIIPFVAKWMSVENLAKINWCRIFLGVTTINELFEQGTDLKIRLLRRPTKFAKWQQGIWPVTKPPSKDEFDLWKETIQLIAEAVATDRTVRRQLVSRMEEPVPTATGRAIVISDGGVKDGIGSFGTIFIHEGRCQEMRGQVPQSIKRMSSYRSELAGLLVGIQQAARERCRFVTICCDNDSALTKCGQLPTIKDSDVDIRLALAIGAQHMTLERQIVKGHADETKLDHQLTPWEKANGRADALATMALEDAAATVMVVPKVRGHIYLNGAVLSSTRRNDLYNILVKGQKKLRVCEVFRFSDEQYESIQWEWVARTQRENPKVLQRWLFKIANKSAPVRHRRYRRQQIENGRCLFCGEEDEEFHCLECGHHHGARKFHWKTMQSELDEIDPGGELSKRIMKVIRGRAAPEDIQQQTLGVPALLVGYWCSSFGLDKEDVRFRKRISRSQRILQFTFRKIYTHHVTATYHREHEMENEKLATFIDENWETCTIPAQLTRFHPCKTEQDMLLRQSHNVKKLWKSLYEAYEANPTMHEAL